MKACYGVYLILCVLDVMRETASELIYRKGDKCLRVCSCAARRTACTACEVTGFSPLGLTGELHSPVVRSQEQYGHGVGSKHSVGKNILALSTELQ